MSFRKPSEQIELVNLSDQPTTSIESGTVSESIIRLNQDLRKSSRLLGRQSARRLVDFYYQIQNFRTTSANQVREAQSGDPSLVLDWVFTNMRRMESDIQRALGEFASRYKIGQWMQSITGIGPVISAGMLAHLDIRKAKTAGQFWRFAGYDPTVKWEKKTKRPWNADLKCLCYKMSDCFVKFQNHKNDYYGAIYVKRKAYEEQRNQTGELAEQAASILINKKFRDDTKAKEAYQSGKLPPAHIHARACRYTAKMFLSHLHTAMYVDYFGEQPPVPYAFEHLEGNHRHFIELPNWPFEGEGESLREMKD